MMFDRKSEGKRDNVSRLPVLLGSSSKKNVIRIDDQAIHECGYQIFRGFGTNLVEFEQVFDHLSRGQLFYSEKIGSICHHYSVEVSSDNFSQQMQTGGFHTDFMFQKNPPEYIALLCLKTDPKHPTYGRNQIVSMSSLLKLLEVGFGLSVEELLNRQLPYCFSGGRHFSIPLLNRIDGDLQFKFHQYLVSNGVSTSAVQNKLTETYLAQLHAAMIDVAEDVCLNAGDLLVLSNHHALHRRGECSVSFDINAKVWHSREMASIRFNL